MQAPPNPILEDSLGLLILYDEIIFLSPELCPENMRNLPYVKFLNAEAGFKQRIPEVLSKARSVYEIEDERRIHFKDPFARYKPALSAVTKQPYRYEADKVKYVPDNHSRTIELGDNAYINGSSANFQNVITDWAIREAFALDNCEVVSNSANSVYYETLRPKVTEPSGKVAVGHALVLRGLPNYLDSDGPYHPCLEELRGHTFIEEARRHIDDLVRNEPKTEVDQVAEEILKTAKRVRRQVFQKFLGKHSEYKTIAVSGLTEAIGSQIPGVGFLKDMIAARKAEKEAAAVRWSGFVVDAADGDWTRERLL
jgi:hypothetical protein